MTDSLGRLVADPLKKGSPFCRLHTVLFRVEPIQVRDFLLVYIDLETSSLDIHCGKIVEIGALVEGHGFMFSTVVNPGQDERIDQPSVHGIPASELLSGPSFSEAFWRFDAFLRHAALSVLDAEDDSEGEQQMATAMKPMVSEIRVPYKIRVATSEPLVLTPMMCGPEGPSKGEKPC